MPSIQCAITVFPAKHLTLSAKVESWCPMLKLDVTVWHPDLRDIMYLIENKLERGDDEGYEYNVSRWLRLVDSLVRQALLSVDRKIMQSMQKVSSAVSCLLLLSTLIYIRYPAIGISIDIMAIIFVVITYFFLKRRKQELNNFITEQQQTFKLRAQEFQQQFQECVARRDRRE